MKFDLPNPDQYFDWREFARVLVQTFQLALSNPATVLPHHDAASLVAGSPSASQAGILVWCPDDGSGACVAQSTGTKWVRVDTGVDIAP